MLSGEVWSGVIKKGKVISNINWEIKEETKIDGKKRAIYGRWCKSKEEKWKDKTNYDVTLIVWYDAPSSCASDKMINIFLC